MHTTYLTRPITEALPHSHLQDHRERSNKAIYSTSAHANYLQLVVRAHLQRKTRRPVTKDSAAATGFRSGCELTLPDRARVRGTRVGQHQPVAWTRAAFGSRLYIWHDAGGACWEMLGIIDGCFPPREFPAGSWRTGFMSEVMASGDWPIKMNHAGVDGETGKYFVGILYFNEICLSLQCIWWAQHRLAVDARGHSIENEFFGIALSLSKNVEYLKVCQVLRLLNRCLYYARFARFLWETIW